MPTQCQAPAPEQLQALAQDVHLLEEELAALSIEIPSIAIRRISLRVRGILAPLQMELGAMQRLDATNDTPSSTYPECAPAHEPATFQQALNAIAELSPTSPASLRQEYRQLLEEGCADPVAELIQDFREELLMGLINRSLLPLDELNDLQDRYLTGFASKRVSKALKGCSQDVASGSGA